MKFRKMLVATDFSAGAHSAIAVATRLANASGAELVIGHALEAPTVFGGEPAAPPEVLQELRDEALHSLDRALADARQLGAQRVSIVLLDGSASAAITHELESPGFDLLVVGTQGRTGLSRVVLGSVAEKLVRSSPCSVLVVRTDTVAAKFAHVLCPIDSGPHSKAASIRAGEIADADGAKLTLVNVAELKVGYAGRRGVQYVAALSRFSEELLHAAAGEMRTTTRAPIATRSALGAPGGQILALLDEDRTVDLVVMGTHGRTGLKRALVGSVAEKVVRHARCPVLIARAPAPTSESAS